MRMRDELGFWDGGGNKRLSERRRNFQASVERHGFVRTLVRYADNLLRRFVTCEICRIETNSDDFPEQCLEGYETQSIESRRFHEHLCAELAANVFTEAFARGDLCIASLKDDEVVGFTFYTRYATAVDQGMEFRFPDKYIYSYGSRTAPSHRGNRLEIIRWGVGQAEMKKRMGECPPRIFYIDVMNLESRAANRRGAVNNRLIGYSGYIRILGRWICYRSPGCRREGAGFWRAKCHE